MSKQTITGTLDKCYERNGKYSINVNDTWYSTYKTDYTHIEGEPVTFEATPVHKGNRTYWNVSGDVKVTAQPARQAQPSSSGGSAPTGDARQRSIVLQSSYKTGTELLGHLLEAGALSLGAKKAQQYENALDYLDEIVVRIYQRCMNPEEFLAEREDDDEPAIPADDEDWNPTEA